MLPTAELLRQLTSFRPVTADIEAVNRVVRFLHEYLSAAGIHSRIEDCDGRLVLFAATCTEKTTDILMNAHLDVVPAQDEEGYELREEEGWLYGRGTADDLGNCAVIAQALIRAKDRASAGAIFSTDEECGGSTTAAMLDRGYGARAMVLVFDVADYYVAAIAQKGVLNLRLEAHGEACHAAEPWKGKNAIDRLIDGYRAVRALFPQVTPPDEWHDTMAATLIQAGTVPNRVPDQAEMTLNIRYVETTDPDALIQRIADVSGLTVACKTRCPPVHMRADAPPVQELIRHLEQGLGRSLTVRKLNGATDARHFVRLQVPIALVGIPGHDPHGKDERIEVAGFHLFPEVLADFLVRHGQ